MKIRFLFLSLFLVFNFSYALKNKFIDPRNNSNQIIDIGFEEPQGNAYLSKSWLEVLSEIRQVNNIREFKKRNKTRDELCISDGVATESVCPYNWQECSGQFEYENGTSREITNTLYAMKIETEVDTSAGSNMQATYSLSPNCGAIDGARWTADVLRGNLPRGLSGQTLYDQGFKNPDNGKFAMKAFNFGSGCGGMTIMPLPDRITTLKNGGSSVSLRGFGGCCSQTISSGNGQWATVYMEWDSIPDTITWYLDDYGYISTPDSVLGFVQRLCPTGYDEFSEDQCYQTNTHYEYSCPDGLTGDEDENSRYSAWTQPIYSVKGNSANPPANNCRRASYTCPIDENLECVQTSGVADQQFERIYDEGYSTRHDETLIDSKKENMIIDKIDIETETKIEWADKLTVDKKMYRDTDGPDGVQLFCTHNSTWDPVKKLCTIPATEEYVSSEVPDYTTWEGGAGGTWSIQDGGATFYQSQNGSPTYKIGPTSYGFGTFEGKIKVTDSDDDYMGFVLGYQNTDDYYLLSWGNGASNAKPGLYLVKVGSGSKDFWNYTGSGLTVLGNNSVRWSRNVWYTIKVELSSSNMKVYVNGDLKINVSGSYHGGRFGYYNYSLGGVYYKDFVGTNLQVLTCPNDNMDVVSYSDGNMCEGPASTGLTLGSGVTKGECSNGGLWDEGCIKCPVESWTPPTNCHTGCNTTIQFVPNEGGTGSTSCVYEYQTRECPVNRPNDHGTDIAGNTCTVSNINNYNSHCDDCSKTTLTALCPADAEFPSETYPDLTDPDQWFLSGTQCQRTTFEYICSDEDFVIEDGLCKKHYTWYEYTCPNTEWIGPADPGMDCLGTCDGNNCLCNSELSPEENCYQDIPIISGQEPVQNIPATTFETNPNITTSFNGSEYGLTKGYQCVDGNGENCGYDVWKIEGDGERLCFNDKLFHYECIDVQGCTFEGSIEIDKKQSFSALVIEPDDNKLIGFVKGTQVAGSVKSSCIMNGQVGLKDAIGGFNAVKMDGSRMSFWNSYVSPENQTPKQCIRGNYDEGTDTCIAEDQDSYPAILAYKIKADQPSQTKQQYSYGTKVDFTADADGNAIVKVSANFIGYCPVGTLVGDKCRTSERAPLFYDEYTYTCATTGFSPGTDRYCEKDVSIKTSIADSDWFIKDLVVPQNGTTITSNGLTFKIDGALLNVSPNTSLRSAYYANNYTLQRVYEYSCNPGDLQKNETTCISGSLLEGETHLFGIKFLDIARSETSTIQHTWDTGELYNFTRDQNVLGDYSGNSSHGALSFRMIKGEVAILGEINNGRFKMIGNGSAIEYYDMDDNLIGQHSVEYNGFNIQTSGGRVVKSGVFDFVASDGNILLQEDEILVQFGHTDGSVFKAIIKFKLESNKYCPAEKVEAYNSCIDENDEFGFLEFVPSCAEVIAKDSEFFYEGFRERNLLYDFNSIIKYEGFTYARSNYPMNETECQAFADDAGWSIATIDFDKCGEGWIENGDICERTEDAWYDVIDEVYQGKLSIDSLFASTNGSGIEVTKGVDMTTGKKGLFVYVEASSTSADGFHFKPDFDFSEVEVEYEMQGTDNGYRCFGTDWVPLSGPGFDGGYDDFLAGCKSGYSCVQGTPRLGNDRPIKAKYVNESWNSGSQLLVWSGFNYNGNNQQPTVGNCSRSTNIPNDKAGTFITTLRVKGPELSESKPVDNDATESKEKFLENYIPSGTYLDIFGSDGQPGSEPSDIYKTSCNGLLAEGTATRSGSYSIRIDDTTTTNVYCDVSSGSSGWTLAGKIDGSLTTWLYDNAIWTNSTLLNENDTTLNKTEMKNKVWTSKGFTRVKLVFDTNGDQHSIVLPVSGSSLSSLFAGGYTSIPTTRAEWKAAVTNGSLQLNCNRIGINNTNGTAGYGTQKVRVGIFGNQENDCNSPDSFIGVGSNRSLAPGAHTVTAGNWAGNYSPDNGVRDTKSFVYVYIINDDEVFERDPGNNMAYCIIENPTDRTFSTLDMCVKLNEPDNPVSFHCSAVTCNPDETCALTRCEEGQDGMPDYLGTKQEPGFDFNGLCKEQECDANLPYTEMCGRDTGCDLNKPGMIQKDNLCFEQYCPEGDLLIDDPRSKCKVFSCPEGTIEQPDGKCLVPND